MVVRKLLKRKPKTERRSRSADYIAAIAAYGLEPSWFPGQVPTTVERSLAMTWYSRKYISDKKEQFGWLCIWLEKKGHADLLRQVKSLPENKYVNKYLPRTACALARMEDLGARVEADEFIVKKVEESVAMLGRERSLGATVSEDDDGNEKTEEDEEEEQSRQAVLFKERIKNRIGEVAGHVEDRLIDGLYVSFDVYEFLKANNYPTALAFRLETKLSALAEDYEYAITTGEGFEGTPKKVLKDKLSFIGRAVEDLRRYSSNEKKLKQPRKPKPVSVEKKLRDFHYMKESKELKVASVNPTEILGAKELWFYDTRGNTITVLRSEKGMDVHRTTITDYDVANSITKKAGRRPDKWIDRARTDGKVALRRLMEDNKKEALTQVRDRINDNTLLLRVIR